MPPKRPSLLKHLLTIVHAIMALVVTSVGLFFAGSFAVWKPFGAILMYVVAIVFPVVIATRISWSAGYEAGKSEGLRSMRPKPEDPPSESYYASSR